MWSTLQESVVAACSKRTAQLRSVIGFQKGGSTVQAPSQDPFKVLKVSRNLTSDTLRQAYIARTKELHPDLNPDQDTTLDMARVNEAYECLKLALEKPQVLRRLQDMSAQDQLDSEEEMDAFSKCSSEPIWLFVNPFQCDIDPFMWRELNQLATGMQDIERGMYQMGLRTFSRTAIYSLTREQLDVIQQELESMDFGTDVQMCEYMVNTYCARARYTNANYILEQQASKVAGEQRSVDN